MRIAKAAMKRKALVTNLNTLVISSRGAYDDDQAKMIAKNSRMAVVR
jgi:hypothetical protein